MPNCCSWPEVLASDLLDIAGLVVRYSRGEGELKEIVEIREIQFVWLYILITQMGGG